VSNLLDKINSPDDLKLLQKSDLPLLSEEIRESLVNTVANTGGHLGAGLGVVEITIAIHYIFNTPKDKLIWDVGHQCYPHKILTGRKDKMLTIRKGGGLSGFTKMSESKYDAFGAGHSSTSISAGLGMAAARDIKGETNNVVCVIGDGAMSGGMVYEAMNNAGALKSKMIVILNDNEMSISKPVGAMSSYLSRLVSGNSYNAVREFGKKIVQYFPASVEKLVKRSEIYFRSFYSRSSLFADLGFYYIGPINGHDFNSLLPVLKNVRDSKHQGPILIHVVTEKGKGYEPAETASNKMHSVGKFDIATGKQQTLTSGETTYTDVFSKTLIAEAKKDDKIVAITAAMPNGTGLSEFAETFPERFFDVGIAEQHAVTFAAGLACEGFKPFCAIYSSFLQRSYDQIIHDVAIQNLPVRFAIDRAGFTGGDGVTHAGIYDTAFLSCIPNMVLMSPSNKDEMCAMISTMAAYNDGPIVTRYTKGDCKENPLRHPETILNIGKGYIAKLGTRVAILSYGSRLDESLLAAEKLDALGFSTTVADARFAKPLDTALITLLTKEHEVLVTVEEGSSGGFGSSVLQFLSDKNILDKGFKFASLRVPDIYFEQDEIYNQYQAAQLNAEHIVAAVLRKLKNS